jgi:hypothetical protein
MNVNWQEKYIELESRIDELIAEAVAKAVTEATAVMAEELVKATNEILRLRAIIDKDSTNSSKPPSTNEFKPKPNSREKSGKPQGGQKGHPGHRISLPENIEELVNLGQVEMNVADYTDGKGGYVSRYTIDVETRVIVTEHRYPIGMQLPEPQYNEVSYGEEIKAKVILLMNEGIVAKKRLSGIICGMTHGIVNLSTGTMDRFQSDFAKKLIDSGEIDAIEQDLLNNSIMCTDDTSMRVQERIVYPADENSSNAPTYEKAEKKSFKATVRTHSNEQSTLYTVNPKKDIKGIERDGILPEYAGTLCHDHESKFFNYGSDNASCCGHLSRALKGLRDLYKCPWAGEMRTFINGMNEYRNIDISKNVLFCDPIKLSFFEEEYDRILQEGRIAIGQMSEGDFGYSEFNAMLNRLTNHKHNYMLFMHDYNVPFTNNLAERDLRPEKTKQKVSGTFRSWDGIVSHVRVRSFISTIKKRGMDLCESIRSVIQGKPVLT